MWGLLEAECRNIRSTRLRVIVMPSNNSGTYIGWLVGQFPGIIGHLYSPEGWRSPLDFIPYALDNGRFTATTAGKIWHEEEYLAMIEKAARADQNPMWVLVPDVVGNRDETLREWDRWAPRLEVYGWPLAMAVQDGMVPGSGDIPKEAEVVFVGGTTGWKRRTLWDWADTHERVHIGRINTRKWLWECHDAKVESVDGTGWYRDNPRQRAALKDYLERVSKGLERRDPGLFTPDEEEDD